MWTWTVQEDRTPRTTRTLSNRSDNTASIGSRGKLALQLGYPIAYNTGALFNLSCPN